MNKKGFSFVELIIVITLIVLLAVIGVTINTGYQQTAMNSKIISDLETIERGISVFTSENSSLPLPRGNINFYGINGEYKHSQSGAYGVYGSFRENIFAKKYLTSIPVDPRTNQYYVYGKTEQNLEYEIAGVIAENGGFQSRVVGNYTAKQGPKNLIREYNGGNFVFNGSPDIFAYNPERKAMNAKILSYSGSVLLNGVIPTDENILKMILVSGDSIQVGTGGTVQIGFSDGSISTLGDTNSVSEMILAYLDYKDNSFFTKISIALKIGTIWTQASKLDTESEFQIYTSDTTASVRGTIFGVSKKITGETQITVTAGKVLVSKISSSPNTNTFEKLINTISDGTLVNTTPIVASGITTPGLENGQIVNYIEVLEGGNPLGIQISPRGEISNTPISQPLNETTLTNGISLEVENTERGTGGQLISVQIKNNTRFQATDKIVINEQSFDSAPTKKYLLKDNSPLTIHIPTNSDTKQSSQFSLKICRTVDLCTKTLTLPLFASENIIETDEITNISCNGIMISDTCLQNNLSASGYTLVAAADYTKQDDDLYTYNGGRIDGNYNGTGLTRDGYRPSTVTGTGIVYNLATIVDEKDFVIEMEVDGEGFNKNNTLSYLLYNGNTGSFLSYKGNTIRKFFISSTTTLSIMIPSTVENSKIYTLQSSITSGNMYTIKLLQSNNIIYTESKTANTFFSPLNTLFIGKKISILPWSGTIRNIKFYGQTRKISTFNVGGENQVLLKKSTPGSTPFKAYQ